MNFIIEQDMRQMLESAHPSMGVVEIALQIRPSFSILKYNQSAKQATF